MSGDFEQAKSRVCQSEGAYVSVRPLASSWEQRKLGELGFAQSGIGFPDAEQGGTEGTPFFKVSDMNTPGNEYELVASNNYVTAEQIARMGWRPINQVPAIFFAKVGAAVMLNRKRLINEPFLLDNNTMAFSMDSSLLDTQFGQSLFERLDLTSLIQVGALPSFNSSDVESIFVSLPSTMNEQRQIGQYLCDLNTLITLHQRKCQYRSLYGYLSWEQRKLGSIAASFDYGLNAAATEYDGQNKYLRITDIDDTTHEFLKSDLTTPLADLAMSADYLLEEGDLLFARTGASVGKTYLYRQYDGTVYFAGFLIRARIGESADPEFVYQATLTDAYKKYVAITSQRSGQPGVNAQEYADYQLMLPSRTEQQQIGMTLRSLDNLITLHQRKCQYRSLYGYLSWEQRKLNEYLETSREKNESCHFGKDDVLSVSGDYGIVNQIEFQGRSYAGTSVANYGVVHKGDVVYTKSPLRINPYGIIKTNRGNDGIVSTLYAVYHPTEKTHPDFVQVYFEQNARMNNYMAPLVSKGAKNDMKVSAENALKGAVTFPGIKEQEVIASYFSQLDDLITLHQ